MFGLGIALVRFVDYAGDTMATIDNLGVAVHANYAKRTAMIDSINREFRIAEASSIPAQIQVMSIYPKLSDLDLLLGFARCHAPWATFWPPKKFYVQRRPSFTNYRVVPSLGTLEKQIIDYNRAMNVKCGSPDEEAEKEAVLGLFDIMDKINGWLGHVISRVAQFLQG